VLKPQDKSMLTCQISILSFIGFNERVIN
jgi:hypothetical protein